MAVSRLSIIKFFELAITVACIGLHYKTTLAKGDPQLDLLVSGTFVGYLIILVALFAGYLLSTPINKRLDIYFSIIGCALFVASGAMTIQYLENHSKFFASKDEINMAYSKGSLAIINGALFLIDGFLTIRD